MAGVTPLLVASKTIALGAPASGPLDHFVSAGPSYALIVEAGPTALGFAITAYCPRVD